MNFSHDGNVAKIAKIVPKWVDPWEITPQEYDIWTIFATGNRRLHPVESTTCGFSAEHELAGRREPYGSLNDFQSCPIDDKLGRLPQTEGSNRRDGFDPNALG